MNQEQIFGSVENLSLFDVEGTVLVRYKAIEDEDTKDELVIPEGITELGESLFEGCQNIERVILPESLTKIGARAFSHSFLSEIVLPDGLIEIGESAFESTYLDEIVIPSGIKKLVDRVFYNCKFLDVVELPEGLTEIGRETFFGCHMFGELVLPSTLYKIGDLAFAQCASLNTVVFRNTKCAIAPNVFEGSPTYPGFTLKIFYIDETDGEYYPFDYSSNTSFDQLNGADTTASACGGSLTSGNKETDRFLGLDKGGRYVCVEDRFDIFVPDSFACSTDPDEISSSVPRCIVAIYDDDATTIDSPFDATISLSSVLGRHFTDIDLDYSIDGVVQFVFKNMAVRTRLEECDLKVIKQTEKIYIEYTSGNINDEFSQYVATILCGQYYYPLQIFFCYYDHNSLDKLSSEEEKCIVESWLQTITACADGVVDSTYKSNAIKDKIPEEFTVVGGMLVEYTGQDDVVVVPDGVTAIGSDMFACNQSIREVHLPEGLKVIGFNAFGGSSVERVYLPDSLEEIEDMAFSMCHNLKGIYLPRNIQALGEATFAFNSQLTVYVPAGNDVECPTFNAFMGCRAETYWP